MESIKNYLKIIPTDFWIYNGFLGLICYLLTYHSVLNLILFPFTILIIRYICLKYFKNIPVTYVGAYPLKHDMKWALITFVVAFVIYQAASILLIIGALFIIWQEYQS